MRILICMCIACGCLAAQSAASSTAPPASQAKKPPVSGVPKDAVETKPGFFRWTDKDGKVWVYRPTPFGVKRWPADSEDIKQSDEDKQKAIATRTTAIEQGDSIRFEQSTPFGKRTWVRKKSELDETEQKIWAQSQKPRPSTPSTEKE